jgi:hypothetical protein
MSVCKSVGVGSEDSAHNCAQVMKMAIDQTTQAWAACIVTTVDEYVTDTCLMQYTQLLRPAME